LLNSYGWSEGLQHDFEPFAARGLVPGRIAIQHRSGYRLVTEAGEIDARASRRLMDSAAEIERPATGDWVAAEARDGAVLVQHVLPRSSAFVRRASGPRGGAQVVAANVDVAFLVSSLNGDLNLRRLERYLATAYESGARPVIVLTKADLSETVADQVAQVEAIAFDTPVLPLSSRTGEGLDALAEHLQPGRTAVLLGMSGAGKSTLLNALAGEERMDTGAIREADDRGRHTTTHRELVLLPSGSLILDTPGMRELGLWDADEGLATAFSDIEALAEACRFGDCQHRTEPGCAVLAALADGSLQQDRWLAYEKLEAELAFERRKADPAIAAEHRRHWVTIHKAARARMKSKYGADDR
jgi:ribosome biogenesis GTPase